MVERAPHEQEAIDMALANLKRMGYLDELRVELKDLETFDVQLDDMGIVMELRNRRAKLQLLDEIESEAEQAEQRLAEGTAT